MGQVALLHAGQQHQPELEPLGPVQAGEGDPVAGQILQTQDGEPFAIDVPVVVGTAGGVETAIVRLDGARRAFEVRTDERPLELKVDPEFDVFGDPAYSGPVTSVPSPRPRTKVMKMVLGIFGVIGFWGMTAGSMILNCSPFCFFSMLRAISASSFRFSKLVKWLI